MRSKMVQMGTRDDCTCCVQRKVGFCFVRFFLGACSAQTKENRIRLTW